MNVEFQIHGVLSSGQKTWKQEDKDYYTQFYSDQTEDAIMIVEIVNRPHGVSAYYNYLRNNNILSARIGSYFGMTMRIDGAFCRDVKSIYMILDNLFNKMIVGSFLILKEDKFEYSIDSFVSQNDYLLQIEKQFSNMLNAFCSPQDFFEISSSFTSQGTKLCVNVSEIVIPTAVEAIRQRAKLYLSPTYQSKSAKKIIADAKAVADAAVADANARIRSTEDALSKSKQKQIQDLENWKKEKKVLEEARDSAIRDYQELEKRVRKAELDTSINAKISEIKQPLIQLSNLVAERFQEDTYGYSEEKHQPHKKDRPQSKIFIWLPWFVCILLSFALAGSIWYMGGKDADIEKQAKKIELLENSIKKKTNSTNTIGAKKVKDNSEIRIEKTVKYDLSKLRIDIKELPSGAKGVTSGSTYTCGIMGGDYPKDGYWVICEGENTIHGNVFTVSSPSGTQVKITYYHGTEIIKERTIKVL
ncbi:MAG: hypothetical protein IJP70_01720 [Bacteroidales bacterium]|nr:hypothetical protein [Bacteroidales bacterium]